jgi:hypothetical protein
VRTVFETLVSQKDLLSIANALAEVYKAATSGVTTAELLLNDTDYGNPGLINIHVWRRPAT